jgi:hypothetical protein
MIYSSISLVTFHKSEYCEQASLFFSFGALFSNSVAKSVDIFAISCLFNGSSILASHIFAYFVNPFAYAHLYASDTSFVYSFPFVGVFDHQFLHHSCLVVSFGCVSSFGSDVAFLLSHVDCGFTTGLLSAGLLFTSDLSSAEL